MALVDTSKARPLFNRRLGILPERVAFEMLRGGFHHRGPEPVSDARWNRIVLGQESPPGSTALYPAIAIV